MSGPIDLNSLSRSQKIRRAPKLADYWHREHGGPDPADLPRKRRRMKMSRVYEVHDERRAQRPKRG